MKKVFVKHLTLMFSLICLCICVTVIVRWQLQITSDITVTTGSLPMNPVTAVCFVMTAVWIMLTTSISQRSKFQSMFLYFLSILVTVIAVMRLSQVFFGLSIEMERFMYGSAVRTRMSSITAFNFALIGLLMSFSTIDSKRFSKLNNYLIGLPLFATSLCLSMYAIQQIGNFQMEPLSLMAFQSCIAFLCVLAGCFLQNIDSQLISQVLSRKVTRRSIIILFPIWVVIYFAMGVIGVKLVEADKIGSGLAVSFMLVFTIFTLGFAIWQCVLAEIYSIKRRYELNINHELRTPLNGILGFTDILSDPRLPDLQRRAYLDHIRSSTMALSRSIDGILGNSTNDPELGCSSAVTPSLNLSAKNEVIRALVVEDNVINQELIRFILTKHKIKFQIANNGLEAIGLLANTHFDIVLMDVDMPIMNGYEATKQIRDTLLLDTPIVALTASLGEDDIDSCLAAGMNAHLAKPYTERQLLKIINTLT